MEFGILGPLLVRDGEGDRPVAAAKQRALLAALLVRRGQVVPADVLADTVWDGWPPRTAATTLRNYVMRLRKALGEAGHRLATEAGGYVLSAAAEEFDADRFTRLRDLGHDRLRTGDAEQAVAHYEAALALWRGPALVDVPSEALRRAEAGRLAEARLDVLEGRTEAALALGRHTELLGELRVLTAAHPERERLWAQLMTALYRSGRQSEALAVYGEVRRVLADELGVDPGNELRAVHAGILRADPALAAPARTAARIRTVLVTPSQLPPCLTDFTGRTEQSADLAAMLTAEGRRAPLIAVVSGQPGAGKSTLVQHAAHAARGAHPDGTLYADLRGSCRKPAAPHAVLGSFLLALGVPAAAVPPDTDSRTALFRSLLADRRMLVVLDDARDSAHIRPLMPAGPGNSALITARTRLPDLGGSHALHLGPLPADEARQFLARLVGPARAAAEHRALTQLAAACGGLPLALRICGARLAARPSWTVRHLVERLADEGRALDELCLGSLDVRAAFAAGCESLDPPTARAFHLLALAPTDTVGLSTASRLLGEPPARAERVLERLTDAGLLTAREPGRYRYEPLLRTYARERARHRPAPTVPEPRTPRRAALAG
ncbi:BTAD domain-containing putative transcriptional regulator [Kitasatospora sp. DSM 101779]|uniref:AfsR/SARP family transcriptional regulator n=1 Tax=Kitasatospora sp. DSM 101779 TaxID=2853165 RepID=UPI0021D95F4F|nr:BTAD domain-containing putative transcriptional regulator [Kitasatospora sp. DSM 101779]MCU7822098.1 winged helix-turn-helix domain-containing protein [Kitasatospora sp. DSM 101779]